jgi:hypothetical protein
MMDATYTDEETGDEVTVQFPSKFEVCPRCEGHGTYLNPSIGNHAYSAEEFSESFDDEEAEQYFKRGGIYDIACEQCGGKRVIEVPNPKAMNAEQKASLAAWEEQEEERAAEEAADRKTRWYEDGRPMD